MIWRNVSRGRIDGYTVFARTPGRKVAVKRLLAAALVAASLSLSAAMPALATSPPASGQPNVDCPGTAPTPPGFNSGGFTNVAENRYANDSGTTNSMHSGNTAAESQYDVACFRSNH